MSTLPTQIGPFEIIREIARSNDIVYEAFDPRMNRRVAVKELAVPHGASDPQTRDRIARFQREAQAVGMLNHPNIMTVHSAGEDGGRVFMAMEFLDGVSLRKELDTVGSLPLDRACEIALQVLDGLSHAHANGVVHRDIKPDNIQIVSSGQAKITDFGIARLTFQPNLTMDGQVFGTPSYMSPEQVVGKEIDARSDLFSVGVMLYEMLTGAKPFAGDSVVTITYNIVNVSPNPSSQIPNAVWHVVSTALEKGPVSRYATADAMREALARALDDAKAPPPAAAPWLVGAPTLAPAALPPVVGSPPTFAPPPDPYAALAAAYGHSHPSHRGLVAPIYYPAPPRPPLLSPEAKRILGRFVVVFVTLALLLWLLIQFVNAISAASARTQAARWSGGESAAPSWLPATSGESSRNVETPRAPAGPSVATAPSRPEPTAPREAEVSAAFAECRAGDATSCESVLRFLDAGGRPDPSLGDATTLRGYALAGTGRRDEAVALFLTQAQERIQGVEESSRIRDSLYNAEAAARGDAGLEEEVRAFAERNGYADRFSTPIS